MDFWDIPVFKVFRQRKFGIFGMLWGEGARIKSMEFRDGKSSRDGAGAASGSLKSRFLEDSWGLEFLEPSWAGKRLRQSFSIGFFFGIFFGIDPL